MVELLVPLHELGVSREGNNLPTETVWKLYGLDLNGQYGGLQGIGGIEMIWNETTYLAKVAASDPAASSWATNWVVDDIHGNIIGYTSYDGSSWSSDELNPELTAYGPTAPDTVAASSWSTTDTTSLIEATLWRGYRMDPTGFYWMGFRYYDPKGGRFISPDPMGYSGGTMDLYSFANGDPVNYVDPLGLEGQVTNASSTNAVANGVSPYESGVPLDAEDAAAKAAGKPYQTINGDVVLPDFQVSTNENNSMEIHFSFDAFINGNRGDWLSEPASYSYMKGFYEFRTDQRNFGEFSLNKQNARVYSYGVIETSKIGKLDYTNIIAINGTGSSHRRYMPDEGSNTWEYSSKQAALSVDSVIIRNPTENSSIVTFEASAGYPHVAFSPNIDYTISFEFVNTPNGVSVSMYGEHDAFPDYEASLNGILIYSRESPSDGPGLKNLNSDVNVEIP